MSTDTPRPERVTLTDEECVAIVGASIAPDRVLSGRDGHDGSPPDVLLMTVERIVAAREQALREEIAGQIEADCEADEPPCDGCWNAARIARGGAR